MIMKMQFEAEAPQQAVSLSKDLTWLPLSRWAEESLKGSTQHHLSQHSFKLPSSSRTEISSFFMLAPQPAQLKLSSTATVWYLNLLVRNIIEREIKREMVQMKPPINYSQTFISIHSSSLCCQLMMKKAFECSQYWFVFISFSGYTFWNLGWKSWGVYHAALYNRSQ